MGLEKQTKIGLTFGQIVSIIMLIAAVMGAWIDLNNKVNRNVVQIESIKEFQTTTKEDYRYIIEKLDKIDDKLDGKMDK